MLALPMMSVPEPDFVRPMAPVIFEPMVAVPEELNWWTMRSRPLPEVIVPPLIAVALAPTVDVISRPPLAIVRPAVASSVTAEALLNRRELMESALDPMELSVPLSTSAPAAYALEKAENAVMLVPLEEAVG